MFLLPSAIFISEYVADGVAIAGMLVMVSFTAAYWENLDEQGQLKSKAAMFTKRTIRPERTVTSVDTPAKR